MVITMVLKVAFGSLLTLLGMGLGVGGPVPHLPVSFSFSENVFDFLRLTSDDLELTI
eukprot:CAMPEP_0116065810 /NCGR_PEP_ID=MMETSP0322-20121206/10009_1 /TAXON_ID=163516 /ORGANISM="Leptocylindrus danicus var. apora, Strain B651" /LENGTH=56 /DNA_ID=CAMNT_0003552245 /DNA_START=49 /DNA_END=217 /DNA_ORIENTATION=-